MRQGRGVPRGKGKGHEGEKASFKTCPYDVMLMRGLSGVDWNGVSFGTALDGGTGMRRRRSVSRRQRHIGRERGGRRRPTLIDKCVGVQLVAFRGYDGKTAVGVRAWEPVSQ